MEKRTIREIAFEISRKWANPYFAAVPYLQAMRQLECADDTFGVEVGRSIVAYFLSNAGQFRGADARRLKKELKSHLK